MFSYKEVGLGQIMVKLRTAPFFVTGHTFSASHVWGPFLESPYILKFYTLKSKYTERWRRF